MATSSLYGTSSESTGLYGIGAASGGTYFEWFIFQDSATAPATPTGGSWSFTTNTGTAPSGWLNAPPAAPVNQVWVSIAIVDSRNTSALVWSAPGLMTGSGLPVLTGSGVPSAGTGLNGQLYINTATTPQSMYNKQSGAWVQLTGATLYATAGANTNITSLTGITGGISSATYLQLNTAGDGAAAAGKFQWDPTFGGPAVGMAGGNVNQNIGQDQFCYVYNNTGTTITKGQVVYVSGSQGQRLTVALARANADATSLSVLGFANENIANNASGFVATVGLVSGINTSGFADGASIWLSPTTAGGFTVTKPVAPNHLVLLGYVVKGGSVGGGSIFVFTQNGYELDELHDVLITSVANKNLLQYNSAVPAWVNIAGPTGTIVGTTDAQTLTNKTISGSSNTLTNIGNASLVNSSVNVNGVNLTLGATQLIGADWILPSYAGNAGKVLALNPSASDVQWIPAAGVGTVTSVNVSGGTTGLTTFGGPVTAAGTITLGGTLAVANGGTGSTTTQTALNTFAGSVTNGSYLRGNGTNVVMSAIQASDVPTLNQNTTGNAATATTATNVSGGTASVSTLTASSTVTLSGGTANGIAYLNGSKVLTTGSALTFDGSVLTVNNTNPGVAINDSTPTNGRSFSWLNGGANYSYGQIALRDVTNGQTAYTYSAGSGFHNWFTGGSEQMRLTSTGLGIGTSSPGARLVVQQANNNNDGIRLFASGSDSQLITRYLSSIDAWQVTASYGSTGAYKPITWATSDTERMRLDSSGNLGIGTSSPAARLSVFGVGGAPASSTLDISGYSSFGHAYITTNASNTASDFIIGTNTAVPLIFYTNAAERLRLDASGNLGLGVTPSAWRSTAKAFEGLAGSIWDLSTTVKGVGQNAFLDSVGWKYKSTAAATNYEQAGGSHAWYTAPSGTAGNAITFTQSMTLDASGNLGIGTSSPAVKADVINSSTYQLRVATTTGNYSDGGIFLGAFGTSDQNYWGAIQYVQSDQTTRIVNKSFNATGGIDFYVATTLTPARAMKLDSFGNLGLGVTPSAWSGSWRAFQFGSAGSVSAHVAVAATRFSSNEFDGTYINSTQATRYEQYEGQHKFYTAPSGTAGNAISFTQVMTLDANGRLMLGATSVPDSGLSFYNSNGTVGLGHYLSASVGYMGTWTNHPVAFATNGSERARIDSSGNLLVGTTSGSGRITSVSASGGLAGVFFGAGSGSKPLFVYNDQSSGATSSTQIEFANSTGGTVGSITSNGSSTAYNTSSDYRLKNITGPITTSGAYIDSLNPVEGTWKADGSTFVGLLAHEVQEVSRTTVATGTKDGEEMQGMDYSSAEIIANLIAEVKALRTRVAALESI